MFFLCSSYPLLVAHDIAHSPLSENHLLYATQLSTIRTLILARFLFKTLATQAAPDARRAVGCSVVDVPGHVRTNKRGLQFGPT